MGTVIGVVIGYALGTRAGPEGWDEFKEAWKVISTSDEVKDLLSGGFSLGRDLVRRGTEVLARSGTGPDAGFDLPAAA
jgi:hypothetical protein